MIPKIIHYCWFGKGLMPHSQKKCIRGWKKLMPDYKIMRWDESNFDLDKHPLAKYACKVKKYALASDVCRYNVLAEYGGIYLDTDVEVFQRYDEFLQYNLFTGIELYNEFITEKIQENYLNEDGSPIRVGEDIPRLEILTSTLACCPNHQVICDIRDYYNSVEASPEAAFHYRDWVNNDRLVARYLTKYGFRYKNETQKFGDNMIVFGTGTFGYAFSPAKEYTVSYHHNAATWESERWNRTRKISYFVDKFGLLPVYQSYKSHKRKVKKNLLHPVIGEIWCLHRVVTEQSIYPSNKSLEITPDYLEELIEEYKSKGWTFVSIDKLIGCKSVLRSKMVNISFDDGFNDVFSNAFPVLIRHRVPFTIYLTTGFPENTADIWWIQLEKYADGNVELFERIIKEIYESGRPMAEVMHEMTSSMPDMNLTKELAISWEQLKEMVDSGLCTIGAHTSSHPGLTRLDVKLAQMEIKESKEVIEQNLGIPVNHFSYPHSMYDDKIVDILKEEGFSSSAVGYGDRIRKGDNLYLLNRRFIVQQ